MMISRGFVATAVSSAAQRGEKKEEQRRLRKYKKREREREAQRRLVDERVKVETSNAINGR